MVVSLEGRTGHLHDPTALASAVRCTPRAAEPTIQALHNNAAHLASLEDLHYTSPATIAPSARSLAVQAALRHDLFLLRQVHLLPVDFRGASAPNYCRQDRRRPRVARRLPLGDPGTGAHRARRRDPAPPPQRFDLRVRLRGGCDEDSAYLFVLVEFQPAVDHLTALRLSTYVNLLYRGLDGPCAVWRGRLQRWLRTFGRGRRRGWRRSTSTPPSWPRPSGRLGPATTAGAATSRWLRCGRSRTRSWPTGSATATSLRRAATVSLRGAATAG